MGYLVYVVRGAIRRKYRIPETHCSGFEDILCAVCCTPCSICQMMRHVHAYELTGGSPFNLTSTGDADVDLGFMYSVPTATQVVQGAPTPPALSKEEGSVQKVY